jgi:quinol monooxygenase YgiN
MSVVVIVTAFPIPEHRAEVIAAFEAAITRVHDEPGVELYALHEGPDRLVMIEKYESEQVRSEHLKGAALTDLRSALEGKLSSNLDAQVLVPHPAGNPQKGRCDRADLVEGDPVALARLTRFGSCLRVTGRSTRHDPLPSPLHASTPRQRGASASPKHHAAATRSG